ncbi:MAG: imidazole glycerol phosphate synthase subunit HisH, partial [Deltaproteobacteria bacterium]|nr:imidazole glycerol phosphate synthase subunit HisH [Deltaproteobacteria bacterium]
MIAVVDYGMGNLRSVQKGLERVGFDAEVTRDPGRIADARGVVLPGVGAFHSCMENLQRFGLVNVIQDVVRRKRPFLGICLGLQLLFDESEEFGSPDGLCLVPGKVLGFTAADDLKVPHMGWNAIEIRKPTR